MVRSLRARLAPKPASPSSRCLVAMVDPARRDPRRRAAVRDAALESSGDTRSRVVAAQLASQAIETVRGPAADPTKFTNGSHAGDRADGHDPDGQRAQVHDHPGRAVGRARLRPPACATPRTSSNDAARCRSPSRSRGRTWAAPSRCEATHALAAGRCVLLVERLDRGEGAATRRRSPCRASTCRITGTASDTQATTERGLRVLRLPAVGPVHGVGDRRAPASVTRSSSTPSQTTSVVVGQIDVDDVQLRHGGDDRTVTGWHHRLADDATPATNIPVGVGNTGLQPYFQSRTRIQRADPTVVCTVGCYPYASGYSVFAGNCTDSNPLGKDTNRNPFYPTRDRAPIVATSAGATATTPVPLYDGRRCVVKNGGYRGRRPRRSPRRPTTGYRGAVQRGVHERRQLPAPAPTLGLVVERRRRALSDHGAPARPLDAQGDRPGRRTGVVNVWVKPDGVYLVDGAGVATTIALRPRDDCDLMIRRFRMLRARARRTEAGTTRHRDGRGHRAAVSLVVVAAFGAVVRRCRRTRSSTTNRFTATSEAQTIADRSRRTCAPRSPPRSTAHRSRRRRERRRRSTRTSARCTRRGNSPDRRSSTRTHEPRPGTNVYALPRGRDRARPVAAVGNYTYRYALRRLASTASTSTRAQPMFTYYEYDSVARRSSRRSIPRAADHRRAPRCGASSRSGSRCASGSTPNAPIAADRHARARPQRRLQPEL